MTKLVSSLMFFKPQYCCTLGLPFCPLSKDGDAVAMDNKELASLLYSRSSAMKYRKSGDEKA